jgi:hypothetical protein
MTQNLFTLNMHTAPEFQRYIGINYSGAEVIQSSLPALRVYAAAEDQPAVEINPPAGFKKYWTRQAIADWLVQQLVADVPTLVGINHAFSFPLDWYVHHRLPPDWSAFLEDFCHHWPTGKPNTYVCFVRDGVSGNYAARHGNRSWHRRTDARAGRAPSLFDFERPRSIAVATHAGLPWLLHLRKRLPRKLHIWPLDGWHHPSGKSVLVEVYPPLYTNLLPQADRTRHQQAAYATAAWLQAADRTGRYPVCAHPNLEPEIERIARLEGWIFGVL